MFAEMDTGGATQLSAEKVDTNTRLGFMDLEEWIAKHGFCYYLVWCPGYNSEMSCQCNLGGRAGGEYGEKMMAARLKCDGRLASPSGLAGRTFANKNLELNEDATSCAEGAKEVDQAAYA